MEQCNRYHREVQNFMKRIRVLLQQGNGVTLLVSGRQRHSWTQSLSTPPVDHLSEWLPQWHNLWSDLLVYVEGASGDTRPPEM